MTRNKQDISLSWLNKYSKLILSFEIILVAGLLLTYFLNLNHTTNATSPHDDTSKDLNKNELRWHQEILKSGGQNAYKIFSKEMESFAPGLQHTHSHFFGKALYVAMNIEGVSVCDSNFNYGCYHEFLGNAIQDNGISIVNKLNESCRNTLASQALGCQHGIGHGIASYLGYEFENLNHSLELCNKLPFSDPIGGCTGGVFMEYNFQTMMGTEAQLRQYDDKNPYFPCLDLSSQNQESCFYWQTQWWVISFKGEVSKKYVTINNLCRKLNEANKKQCFTGAGNIAGGLTDYNIKTTISLCKTFKEEGDLYCRMGAIGSFNAIPKFKDTTYLLCEELSPSMKKTCLQTLSNPV